MIYKAALRIFNVSTYAVMPVNMVAQFRQQTKLKTVDGTEETSRENRRKLDESGTRQPHMLCAESRKLSLVSAVLRSLQATSLTRGVSNSVTLGFLARIASTSRNTKYWNTQPNWFSWAPHGGGGPVRFMVLLPPWPDTEGHHSFLPQSDLQFLYDRGSNCTFSAASSHQWFPNSWIQSFDGKKALVFLL